MSDMEYAVRERDALSGEQTVPKPTLAEAYARVLYLRHINETRSTYGIAAEVLERTEGGMWTALTDQQVTDRIAAAWKALDEAFQPVLEAGLQQLAEQQKGNSRG